MVQLSETVCKPRATGGANTRVVDEFTYWLSPNVPLVCEKTAAVAKEKEPYMRCTRKEAGQDNHTSSTCRDTDQRKTM